MSILTPQPQGYINTTIANDIATIEFFHPQSNSLPSNLLNELESEITSAGTNNAVKVIILSSAGEKAFCAGASFAELAAVKTREEGAAFFGGFSKVINAMRKAPKLVIVRVHGKCVGGGVGLAAAADYCIAVEGADIKLSELAIGIGPFVIGQAVERKIGLAAFSQLTIDATNWYSAAWAEKKGLFTELHSSIENADVAVEKLSQTLSQYSAEAMAEIKAMLWQGTGHWDELLHERAAISGKLVLSSFTKEAIAKFKK